MGLRIQKAIGWGLLDLDEQDHRLTKTSHEEFWRLTVRDLYEDERKFSMGIDEKYPPRMSLRGWHKDDDPRWDMRLSEHVIIDSEFGLPNVMLFTIPGHTRWCRRDDIIDYVEAGNGSDLKPKAYELEGGIYPYIGTYMDSRTGQNVRFGSEIKSAINYFNDKDDPKWLKCIEPKFLKPFETWQDAYKFMAPSVPWDIVMLCRFLGVFRDDNTLKQLRPIFYQYWS